MRLDCYSIRFLRLITPGYIGVIERTSTSTVPSVFVKYEILFPRPQSSFLVPVNIIWHHLLHPWRTNCRTLTSYLMPKKMFFGLSSLSAWQKKSGPNSTIEITIVSPWKREFDRIYALWWFGSSCDVGERESGISLWYGAIGRKIWGRDQFEQETMLWMEWDWSWGWMELGSG